MGREGKEVGEARPSPCGGDSIHHHGEKNSMLRYQKTTVFSLALFMLIQELREALQKSIVKSILTIKTYCDSCGNYLPLGY